MTKYIETTGKTEEEAIEKALAQLGLERDDVSVELIERAKSGFWAWAAIRPGCVSAMRRRRKRKKARRRPPNQLLQRPCAAAAESSEETVPAPKAPCPPLRTMKRRKKIQAFPDRPAGPFGQQCGAGDYCG